MATAVAPGLAQIRGGNSHGFFGGFVNELFCLLKKSTPISTSESAYVFPETRRQFLSPWIAASNHEILSPPWGAGQTSGAKNCRHSGFSWG